MLWCITISSTGCGLKLYMQAGTTVSVILLRDLFLNHKVEMVLRVIVSTSAVHSTETVLTPIKVSQLRSTYIQQIKEHFIHCLNWELLQVITSLNKGIFFCSKWTS